MVGRYILKFCSVVLLLVLTVAMHGQIKCRIEHYSTEDGLSHSAVASIIKSSDGFMWFGAWDGINRFDGHNFVTCKSHPGDSSGLKSNRIDIIFDRIIPTSGEKVWLITTNQGVFCVTSVAAASPGITRYSPVMPGVFQLRADVIKFLCADETNNICIGTEKGLLGLSLNEAEVYKKKYINLNNLNNQDFTCVTKDNEHRWFDTTTGMRIFQKNAGGNNLSTGYDRVEVNNNYLVASIVANQEK